MLAHEAPPAAATALIHKRVAFQFDGHSLQLGLSQSLFSSYEVDAGSRLLLKSIAQQLATLPEERRRLQAVLDLGCGTGVLGLALARRYGAALTARDRDALALAVTAHNAALNGVACTTRGGIDVSNLDGSRDPGGYDLVVANLPAKAGAPVLARLLAAAAAVTAPGGRIAVVVVTPLAAQTRSQLAAVAEPIHEVRGTRHTVLHARPRAGAGGAPPGGAAGGGGKTSGGAEPLAAYVRHRGEFTLTDRTYHLGTVYGVPDFDTPSHLTRFTAGPDPARRAAVAAAAAAAAAPGWAARTAVDPGLEPRSGPSAGVAGGRRSRGGLRRRGHGCGHRRGYRRGYRQWR